ncbi:MAG: hypothetical protein F2872_02310 [Actinobacteria bacterium]|jgi:hypothetical protein|nr:hypothetical protein [Actinomycetota bacterium]
MSGTDEQVPAPAPAEDELKRRFREALERKNSGGATGSRGENDTDNDNSGPNSHDGRSPAKSQRTFRRKSGG